MSRAGGPVFTLLNECHDCYKCIRLCPVKAIEVKGGRAEVIPGRCLACGRCVSACPSRAKFIRHDLDAVRDLTHSGQRLIVSLAPSWRASFDKSAEQMVGFLKILGVEGVSETALGAQEVSLATADFLRQARPDLYISSACPVIVDYIRLYRPQYAPNIVPLASPALTHAAFLKKTYGEEIKVVFIGPCIGKKNEADRHPELLAGALTFDELDLWLTEEAETFRGASLAGGGFVPSGANEGGLYPMDGGMIKTLSLAGVSEDEADLVNIASLDLFMQALESYEPERLTKPLFIEAMACPGGCLAGPCSLSKRSDFFKMAAIKSAVELRPKMPASPAFVLPAEYEPLPVESHVYSFDDYQRALRSLGKILPEDEMNCSGCGYATCREMARALLDGRAEPAMCISHMRKIASRKADALLKSMPSAMVVVDAALNILEVNEAFVRMFTDGATKNVMTTPEHFVGEPVESWISFAHLLKTGLKTGGDIYKEHYHHNKRLYDINIFSIEKFVSVGALVTDMTVLESGRDKIAKKAREVIAKNITTVQEIAFLLGEHMVETEILLSSIAEDFSADEVGDDDDDETPGDE